MSQVSGCTLYATTMGTSASAASSVVVPDLASAASAAANTGIGIAADDLRAGPGSGYSPPAVPGDEHPVAAALLEQPAGGVAERLPEPPDLLRPAARKDAEHAAAGRDAEPRAGLRARGPAAAVHQRMSHVLAPEAEPAEEALLEREHDGEPVDRGGEPAGPPRPPGPELGRNVVEHLGPRLAAPPRRRGRESRDSR